VENSVQPCHACSLPNNLQIVFLLTCDYIHYSILQRSIMPLFLRTHCFSCVEKNYIT
jgi:hypothetical protein